MSIYISGPMTGYEDFNRPAFFEAEARIREIAGMDAAIINPAALDLGEKATWNDYMRRHVVSIATEVSHVLVLPGWMNSKGARMEVNLARDLGIPVNALDWWLRASARLQVLS